MSCPARVVAAIALGPLLSIAVAAHAQTPKPKRVLEIEVHGGFSTGGGGTGGNGVLPEAQGTFATAAGSPTRQVSSWYFGDGALLLNQFNASIGPPANLITPLDPALTKSAASRSGGGMFGARVGLPLTNRMTVEVGVDIGMNRLVMTSGALSTIEDSRRTFQESFQAGLEGFAGVVTSTSAIVDKQGQQLTVTGGVRFSLPARGRLAPFVTIAGGLAHSSGEDTVTLNGNYRFLSGNGLLPKNETDSVSIKYSGGGSTPVLVLGGGFKLARSAKAGWRLDGQVWIGKSSNTTEVSATPSIAPVAANLQSVLIFIAEPSLQISTQTGVDSSLSGKAISGFRTFTGSGSRVQVTLTAGYFFRF